MSTTTLDRTYPLTPLQQGMLFHSRLAPHAGVYVQQLLVTLPEAVDAGSLRSAWRFVVQRHAVLRTAFTADDAGEPFQEVGDDVEVSFVEYDWSGVPDAERDQRLHEYLDTDRRRGFDPADAPLTRLALIRRDAADFLLVWTFHHAL